MSTRRSVSVRKSISFAVFGLAVLAAGPAAAVCGDPTGDGTVATNDALYALRAGVAQVTCPLSICDVDGNAVVNTADALRILRNATGLPPALACLALPDDPRYDELWGLDSINAPEVWTRRTDCSDVTVAVIDTGIDYYHDDLRQNLWNNPGEFPFNRKDDDGNGFVDDVYGWDFVDNDEFPFDEDGHGTHVAGTIGAVGNTTGTVGVCWSASIMGVRFLNEFGFGFSSDSLQAIDYARKNGAKVINNSWGGGNKDSGEFFALKAASDEDIVLVMAAGNDGSDNDTYWVYPPQYLLINQINVAAIAEEGDLAGFSNFGDFSVHVAAPGVDIVSTTPKDTYDTFQGTSMAAPHVAGAAAMLRAEFPWLSALDVKRAIMNGAAFNEEISGMVVTDGQLDLQAAFAEAEFAALAGASVAGLPSDAGIQAEPTVANRKVLRSYSASGKFTKRQDVEETYTNGVTKKLSRVADHVIVTVEQESAIGALASSGFRVRGRLKTEAPTFLIEAPDGVDETIAALEGVEGVVSASADYILTAQ
jgi:thermitase